jgi:hypothetical protein
VRRLFWTVFAAGLILSAAPFWLTRILPMQDYPQFLVFARAYRDCMDPASPFYGTYTRGFALSPLLLPILVTRAFGLVAGLESGGRVVWTLYAVGLPLASLYLLRVLGRDRWAVLLVFPLVISFWVVGGFFAFATAAPLLVLGLALGVRWLVTGSVRHGVGLAAVVAALHLWHSLAFAQLLFDFGVLWILLRAGGLRARLRALAPLVPGLGLFVAWMLTTVRGRSPATHPPTWGRLSDTAVHFFDFIAPIVPHAATRLIVLALVLVAGALFRSPRAPLPPGPFRIQSPFALLAVLAVVSYVVLPATCFGVEGISNRQPWIAALLFVFGWSLPERPRVRAALLSAVGSVGVVCLLDLSWRFAAFSRESGGASRLIDRLGPGDTLLAPIGAGSTPSFPSKPLIALELYATVRHGGLPRTSFAGYDINFIRYVGGQNPMPSLGVAWLRHPELTRFDYVMLRGPARVPVAPFSRLRLEAQDGEYRLFAVIGSKAHPQ